MGRRVVEAFVDSADLVFELVERHAIACDAVRAGWLQLAPDARSMKANVALAEQWQRRGVAVQVIDGEETARRVGSEAYVGAMLDPRCGSLQPLSYARGLARAALDAGATVHGASPALSLKREANGWRAATPDGAVVAETVILATNGYTDQLWPGLRRSIIPVHTFQAATEPLGENLRRSILPGGEVVTENRAVGFHYYRIDAGGRLIMGGRATFTEAERPRLYRVLHEVVPKLSPQLADVRWQYRWAEKLALTSDYMPRLHEPEPGVLMALGYNGHGVAPATLMGKLLADRALGMPQSDIPFPFSAVRPLPLHGLHPPVLHILLQIKRLREFLGF
jgi:glycine/D-amino acid oxidase-like deaminating enzyme